MAKAAGRTNRPVGRDEIIPAVLCAASRLFAERGPDAVSVRDVAAEARVNHALVHRHFGSKDELIRLVLEAALGRIADAWPEPEEMDGSRLQGVVIAARREQDAVRIIAWALMAGHPVDDIVREHPVAERLLGLLHGEVRPDLVGGSTGPQLEQPEVAVAALTAMVLGWAVFEPWINRASGVTGLVDYDPATAIAEVASVVLQSAGWKSPVPV